MQVTLSTADYTIDGSQMTAASSLDIYSTDVQLTNADHLTGGVGVNDVLHLTATGGTADLRALAGGIDKVVVAGSSWNHNITLDAHSVSVDSGHALTIDASAMNTSHVSGSLDTSVGTLDVEALSSSNDLHITGSQGNNYIELGGSTGNDVVDLSGSTRNDHTYLTSMTYDNHITGVMGIATALDGYVDLGTGTGTVTGNTSGSGNFWIDAESGGGDKSVTLGNGDNVVYIGAAGANDTVALGNGNNYVESFGDAANTLTVTAGNGNNFILGGAGNDSITAGNGNNTIVGGAGNDTIIVGNGVNSITGGAGADTLTGGTGVDTFHYIHATDSSGASTDTITSFKGGSATGHDIIDLTAVITNDMAANTTPGDHVHFLGNVANASIANTALTANSGHLQVVYVTGEHTLYADVNDDGVIDTGDMAITLTGVTTVAGVDFTGNA